MSELQTRSFEVDWQHRSDSDDGRTIDGRIIPYGEVASITEPDKDTGQLVTFQEQFLRGSCRAMAQLCEKRGNLSFVPYVLDHEENRDSQIGYMRSIREENDGAHATFRVYDAVNITKVMSMLRESHSGLSVAFRAIRPPKMVNGIVSHVQVVIGHVAATASPAYVGAGITGMRDEVPVFDTPKLNEVMMWLEAQKAHV